MYVPWDHHKKRKAKREMASSAHHHDGLICYPSIQQGGTFVSVDPDHMFNLTTAAPVDMIGFSKNNAAMWKPHDSSSSAAAAAAAPWLHLDDSSLHSQLFPPCDQPPQGLSLSLSSTNPSSIALHSFDLRHPTTNPQPPHGFLNAKASNVYQGHFLIKNSKFLLPAQDLLNEFCGLGPSHQATKPKPRPRNNNHWEEHHLHNNDGGSSKKPHPLSSLEFVELQKRKTKLLAMLEEVDRRYKNYCNQMKAVVSSFEAVAGSGAARVYSALALKAMSRHFKCLKEGIVDQIEATRKSMGEKEPAAVPGATKGETPRLKVIDQALRQQRAFQQMSIMETHPWRPQRGLPERSVSILRAWLFEHFLHPYPSDVDKHILARQTGLSRSQVSNWFINARVRLWKPMVEEMYIEEAKENENENNNNNSSEGGTNNIDPDMDNVHDDDQKPARARLLRIDSECVSSIINNSDDPKNQQQQQQHEQCLGFGPVDIDFSSYAHNHQSFNRGAVSLTLGLQQHGGESGVSLAAFPPAATDHDQGAMFYSREHIEECQTVQYSLLDGEGQSMPYRNLMGTHMLHDLA